MFECYITFVMVINIRNVDKINSKFTFFFLIYILLIFYLMCGFYVRETVWELIYIVYCILVGHQRMAYYEKISSLPSHSPKKLRVALGSVYDSGEPFHPQVRKYKKSMVAALPRFFTSLYLVVNIERHSNSSHIAIQHKRNTSKLQKS